MLALTDMSKLRREIEIFQRQVTSGRLSDLRPADRRAMKADLDWCMQRLDELRNLLADTRD